VFDQGCHNKRLFSFLSWLGNLSHWPGRKETSAHSVTALNMLLVSLQP
jgi:hypothetical protein